jgi:hypothetical protein
MASRSSLLDPHPLDPLTPEEITLVSTTDLGWGDLRCVGRDTGQRSLSE